MNKTQIKKTLSDKIKFGKSMGRCAIGHYLFESALPYTNEGYIDIATAKSAKFALCIDDNSLISDSSVSQQYKKEKWYVKNPLGWVENFFLWKRIY